MHPNHLSLPFLSSPKTNMIHKDNIPFANLRWLLMVLSCIFIILPITSSCASSSNSNRRQWVRMLWKEKMTSLSEKLDLQLKESISWVVQLVERSAADGGGCAGLGGGDGQWIGSGITFWRMKPYDNGHDPQQPTW